MSGLLWVSVGTLWVMILLLGFLVLGTLRALGVVRWQLEQLQATTPSRIGRDGLKPGVKAPAFILPTAAGGERSLSEFFGRRVLLVFTQSGCGPCRGIIPELNRIHDRREHQVVVVNNGEPGETRQWAEQAGARFPVCVQEKFSLSKRYEVFASPFAFLIDEAGLIVSKGIAGTSQHLGYVLSGAGGKGKHKELPMGPDGTGKFETAESSSTREVIHA